MLVMSDAAHSDGELPAEDIANEAAPQLALPAKAEAEPPATPEPAKLKLLRFEPSFDESPHCAGNAEIPHFSVREERIAQPAPGRAPRDWKRLRAAASLIAVLAIGAAAAAAHVHGLRVANAEEAQARALAHRLDAMSKRLETVEATRSRDELANLRKVLAEIKTGAANTRDMGGAVAQLASRMDKLEKEQGSRLDKLGDRIDRDAAARLADFTARLDKLEAKVSAAAVPAAPAKIPPKLNVAKAGPAVSYEQTGSIDRPSPRLRGFHLSEIHNGYAMIVSPGGEFVVAPGDVVPGGGRVLRIERRGRDWVVVTTQGQIVASDD
jgi:hypothetical protein